MTETSSPRNASIHSRRKQRQRKKWLILGLVVIVVFCVSIGLGVGFASAGGRGEQATSSNSQERDGTFRQPSPPPSSMPSATFLLDKELMEMSTCYRNLTDEKVLHDTSSPQYRALQDMRNSLQFMQSTSSENKSYVCDEYSRQYYILSTLFHSLNGPSWTESNWFSPLPICEWKGLKCDPEGSITSLLFDEEPYLELEGTIPAELRGLTALKALEASNRPYLQGSLRGRFAGLSKLETVILSFNALTGQLDEDVFGQGHSSNLQHIDLAGNKFDGRLPTRLTELTKLRVLDLGYNDLRNGGFWSSALQKLVHLEKLSLANNEQLGGPIPTTIEKLASLQKLDVSYTSMSGVLPAEVFLLGSNLTTLNLAHCQFTGPLPNDLAQLVSLKSLNLAGNEFSGSIPVEALATLETLEYLDLSGNEFTGSFPSDLCEQRQRGKGFLQEVMVGCDIQCPCCGDRCQNNTGEANAAASKWPAPSPIVMTSTPPVSTTIPGGFPLPPTWPTVSATTPSPVASTLVTTPPVSTWSREAATALIAKGYSSFRGFLPELFNDPTSTYAKALDWVLDPTKDLLRVEEPAAFLQRYTLVHFYYATTSSGAWLSCNPPVFELGETATCIFQQLVNEQPKSYFAIPSKRWLSDAHECSWAGIVCDDNMLVTEISLGGQNLSGPFPESISSLKWLESLSLEANLISGSLPFSIGTMSSLSTLVLSRNLFVGAIPTTLWSTPQLSHLSLENNDLTGPISPEVEAMKNAKFLNLGANLLTGTLPSELQNLAATLATLRVHRTNINGTLPSWIGKLTQLEEISLYRTDMSGLLPIQIGKLHKTLTDLRLHRTGFSGGLPDELYSLTNLGRLAINDCQFSGTISSSIANVSKLETLRLSGNGFAGQIPTTIVQLPLLSNVWLNGNSFTGRVPTEICTQIIPLGILTSLRADCALSPTSGTPMVSCECCTKCY